MERIARLRDNITKVFHGDASVVDRVICCLIARGHVLLEDVPGVGKTVLATTVARSIDASMSRLQMTPDMLPSDVLGVTIYNRDTNEFVFKRGPIFANIVLADEINRTTPRTQTALLEAMNEARVSIDGAIHDLEPPFMVVATQNPYEFEGTYLLPENQLDRFLMRLQVGYPTPEHESQILSLRPGDRILPDLQPAITKEDVLELQQRCDDVTFDQALIDYIVAFAGASRVHEELLVGLSPRGALALTRAARATALCSGRDYVIPEDIIDNIEPVCAHRVIPRTSLQRETHTVATRILQDVMQRTPSPV